MPLLLLKGPPHLPATTTPLASKVTDAFTSQDTVKWAGYGTGVTATGGQLVIVPASGYPGLGSNTAYRLTDESVFVKAVQLPAIADGTAEMLLRLQVSAGNSFTMGWTGGSGFPSLVLRETVAGANSNTNVTYDPVAMRFWRIRSAGPVIFWETSPEGETWTIRRTKTTVLDTSLVTIIIFAGFYGSGTPTANAIFDSVNIADFQTRVAGASLTSASKMRVSGDTALLTYIDNETFTAADGPHGNNLVLGRNTTTIFSNELRMVSGTAGGYADADKVERRFASNGTALSVADVDVTVSFRKSGETNPVINARTQEAGTFYDGGTGYSLELGNIDGTELKLTKAVAFTYTTLASVPFTVAQATNYKVRFQVKGTSLRAWITTAAGTFTTEPQINVTDNGITAVGRASLGMTGGGSAVASTVFWDNLTVTNGGTPIAEGTVKTGTATLTNASAMTTAGIVRQVGAAGLTNASAMSTPSIVRQVGAAALTNASALVVGGVVATPAVLTLNAKARSVQLAWTADGSATYLIERSPAGANTWATVASGRTGVGYVDATVAPSTAYDYRLNGGAAVTTTTPAAVSSTATYANQLKDRHLELYLRLGDTNTTALDESGNARNGTYNGSSTQGQTGITGDGNAGVVFPFNTFSTVAHDTAFNLGSSAQDRWTLSFGLRVITAGANTFYPVISKGQDANTAALGWLIYNHGSNGRLSFKHGGSDERQLGALGTTVVGTTNHYVITWNGTTFAAYRDGVLLGNSGSLPGVATTNTSPLYINRNFDGGTAHNFVDEVALLSFPLTASEITTLNGALPNTGAAPEVTGGAALTNASSLSALGTGTQPGAAALTNASALSVTAIPRQVGAAALTNASALAVLGPNLLSTDAATADNGTTAFHRLNTNTTLSAETTIRASGTGSVRVLSVNATLPQRTYTASLAAHWAPVVAGTTYTGSVAVYGGTAAMTGRPTLFFFNAAGATLTSPTGVTADVPVGSWARVSLSGVAPANAAYAGVGFELTATTTNALHYLDEFAVREGTTSAWVSPGPTVATTQVAAASLTNASALVVGGTTTQRAAAALTNVSTLVAAGDVASGLVTHEGAVALTNASALVAEAVVGEATFVSDDFNRPDGVLGGTTLNWATTSSGTGPMRIVSNAVAAGTSSAVARWQAAPSSYPIFSQATFRGGVSAGVAVAMPSFAHAASLSLTGACYLFRANSVASAYVLYLKESQASTHTQIATTTGITPVVGDVLRLEYDGAVLRCYRNGTLVITHSPAVVIAGQFAVGLVNGITTQSGTVILDDWSGSGAGAALNTRTGMANLTNASSLTVGGAATQVGAAALTNASALSTDGATTQRGAAALTNASTLAVVGEVESVATVPGAAALSNTSGLDVTGRVTQVSAAALTNASTMAAAGLVRQVAGAALSNVSSLTAGAIARQIGTVALTNASSLSAAGATTARAAAALSSGSALAVAGATTQVAAAALTNLSSMATAGVVGRPAAAALVSGSALAVTGIAQQVGAASLTTASSMSAEAGGFKTVEATAALSTGSSLSAAGMVQVRASASLTSAQSLTVPGVVTRLGAAALTNASTLSVGAISRQVSGAALTTTSSMVASSVRNVTADAALVTASSLTTTGSTTQRAAAGLTNASALAVTGAVRQVAAASLTTGSSLAVGGAVRQVTAASLTSTSGLVVGAVVRVAGGTALSSASTLAASGAKSVLGGAALVSANTMSVTGVLKSSSASSLTSASVLSTTGSNRAYGSASLNTESLLVAVGFVTRLAEAVLHTDAVLRVPAGVLNVAGASLTTSSGLSSSGAIERLGTVSLSSVASLFTYAVVMGTPLTGPLGWMREDTRLMLSPVVSMPPSDARIFSH